MLLLLAPSQPLSMWQLFVNPEHSPIAIQYSKSQCGTVLRIMKDLTVPMTFSLIFPVYRAEIGHHTVCSPTLAS